MNGPYNTPRGLFFGTLAVVIFVMILLLLEAFIGGIG